MKKLNWGVIGTGYIAEKFAFDLKFVSNGELIAVASRYVERAKNFATKHNVKKYYGSYDDLLNDPEIDIVYIATPHTNHAELSIKAARKKKHILCEKPMTVNFAQAMAVIEEVKKNDVFFMEAFMYRTHPQTQKLINLIKKGIIGDVKIICSQFSFKSTFDENNRLWNHNLAGGAILDVGTYCVSMSRLLAGVAVGKNFDEPIEIKGLGKLAKTNVDEVAVGIMIFPSGILAQMSTSICVEQENYLRIYGTEGEIYVPLPWFPGLDATESKIIIIKDNKKEEIVIKPQKPLYSIEAEKVGEWISNDKTEAEYPAMSWEDSLNNMKVLDKWRQSFGYKYDFEKNNVFIPTIDNEELKVEHPTKMKYLYLKGLEKPVSRLVLGADIHTELYFATIMFDEFFRLGGNCFDTAHIYYNGESERVLGQWIKNRNLRDKVVILDKGAHTPFCNPEDLTKQLYESLERLQTEYIDIYMIHRDNPNISVKEFIDVLNEHKKAGRIKVFGASNWTLERVEEANSYAKSKGLEGFSAVSNNFSLVKMVYPVWEGAISSSDEDSINWFVKTQMPLFAWSSQARGFFSQNPTDISKDEIVRCWYSEENLLRRERAIKLAKKYNVSSINIALAYVLCQKFPTFALIGPRSLEELKNCMVSLGINLNEEEIKFLKGG